MSTVSDSSVPAALKGWQQHAGRWLQLAIGIGLGTGVLLIVQAWLLARVVNALVFAHASLVAVMPMLWAMLGVFVGRAVLAWASEQVAFEAAVRVKLALRDALYRHVQRLGPAWLSGERSGDVLTTISDGVEALEAYYAKYLPAVALTALVPLAILVFVFAQDWLAALVMIVTAPLIPLFMVLIGKGAERRNQKQWRQLAWMSAHFLDLVQGLTTLRLFNASRREAQMVARIADEYRRGTMAVLRLAFLSSFTLEFFATVSIAIVAVLVGFRLLWGDMSFQHGFFVLLLAPEFYLPLRNLGTQYHARMEAIGAGERIVAILNTAPADLGETRIEKRTDDRADVRTGRLTRAASAQETADRAGAPAEQAFAATPDLKSTLIRFEGIRYRYPDGRHALDGLDLTIHPGETLALVGPSGAGKSTLIQLLLGFLRPQSGRILIGTTPLEACERADWHRQLAWLPQRPHLFPGTVSENIALGQPLPATADVPEALREAARRAHAEAFIEALPQGYATPVGEGGQGLSGGQVQRFALARAFYKDAPLLILDEAAANLDVESEAQVQRALEALAVGRTVVMIAHRLSSVRKADRIAVLRDGAVVASGEHAGLLRDSPDYRALVQAGGGES